MAELVHDPAALKARVAAWRREGVSIGFVPTMGALHEGHLALVRRARAECGRVVVSIFVNPAQFGPQEDFSRYPRTLEADRALCDREADLLYAPAVEAMYPSPQTVWVEPGPAASRLCGPHRPGHFRGVLTVVAKLFGQVTPDRAYFGAKDYQQSFLVRGMVRELAMPLEVVVCPTVREADGLAMSSRNRYLSPDGRRQALCLIRGLRAAEALARGGEGDADRLRAAVAAEVARVPGAEADYIEVVHPETLEPLKGRIREGVAALAVRIGGTRLIDNLRLEVGADL